MIGTDKIKSAHHVLLTDRNVSSFCNTFANNSSKDIKLSMNQLSKIIQSGGFLGRLYWPQLKFSLPLIKNVFHPLARNVLILLGCRVETSAADAGFKKKKKKNPRKQLSLSKIPRYW